MSRQNIIIAAVVVIAIAIIVWAVMPNREEKATAQLDTIYKVEQAGQFDQAVSQYEALIKEYEGTQAAALAADYIERVKGYQERKLIQDVRKNLERVGLVMNGYREMMGDIPTSLEQLDSGEYMFDSDYIAEIPPEGYTYHLRFEPAVRSYTIFSRKDGAATAIRYDASGKTSVVSRPEYDGEIDREGLDTIVKGRMVFLQPKSG